MRKISEQAADAFMNGSDYINNNTKVIVNSTCVEMYLHRNLIAKRFGSSIKISNARWFSNVTKERLNSIPGVSVSQCKGIWYLNGKEWDGSWIEI